MAKSPIDLNNFKVVKFGDSDIERNYINDILHAIVAQVDSINTGGTGVQSIIAGTGINVDSSNPSSPIISTTGGTGVTSLNGQQGSIIITSADGSIVINAATSGIIDLSGIKYTDTGISIKGGSLQTTASPVTTLLQDEVRGISTGNYDYITGASWKLWVYPAPALATVFSVDVCKRSFGQVAPTPTDSIVSGAYPSITGNGSNITSTGSTTTWSSSLTRGDMFVVRPRTNTALVKWWCLEIDARRTF